MFQKPPCPNQQQQQLSISNTMIAMDLIETARNISKRYPRRPIKWPWKKLNSSTTTSPTTTSSTTMGTSSTEISSVMEGFYNVSDCLDNCSSWENVTDLWTDTKLLDGPGTTTDFIIMMITAFVLGFIILSTVIGESENVQS